MIKYYCSKCKKFHIKPKGKLFIQHNEFKVNLSESELWKLLFKRSWKRYTIESHNKKHN